MAWDNFTQSWLGVVFNPVGYMAQHKSVEDASHDYANENPPSTGLNLDNVTEVSFKNYRQNWIDQCSGTLKARDVGYSLANASRNCAARFDEDDVALQVQDVLTQREQDEKALVQQRTQAATKTIIYLIGGFLLAGVLLYLFFSK